MAMVLPKLHPLLFGCPHVISVLAEFLLFLVPLGLTTLGFDLEALALQFLVKVWGSECYPHKSIGVNFFNENKNKINNFCFYVLKIRKTHLLFIS